jgi:predicted small metal-binding protein
VDRTRFECLEADCEFEVEAASDEELIDAVQQHMGEAHDSFELDDVILANATPATRNGAS